MAKAGHAGAPYGQVLRVSTMRASRQGHTGDEVAWALTGRPNVWLNDLLKMLTMTPLLCTRDPSTEYTHRNPTEPAL